MPTACVDGINMYYEYQGSGLPVLFSHSFTSDCTMWTQQAPVISQRYQLITYDIRGMGRTDSPPGEYSLDLHTEDLYQLVRHLGLSQFVLGGLSIGGMIGVHFALAHQELLKGLIIADSSAARPDTPQIVNPEPYIEIAQSRGMAGLADHVISNKLLAPHLQDNPYAIKEYRDRMARNNVVGYCSGMRALSRMRDRTGELGRIAVPTLIIVGNLDLPFIEPSKLMHERIPGSKLVVIPGAGHLANIERPAEFNEAVMAFLDGLR
ncbi:MAG: alpha/beta fold hydrolase [Candidatus Entotheonellia bacterium]